MICINKVSFIFLSLAEIKKNVCDTHMMALIGHISVTLWTEYPTIEGNLNFPLVY